MKKINLLLFAFISSITIWAQPPNDDCSNAEDYGLVGTDCTIFSGTTIDATAGNNVPGPSGYGIDMPSCDVIGINATVFYAFFSDVAEVEFNLLSGENINVALLSSPLLSFCDGLALEVTNNCFTNISASDQPDPMDADLLFTNLIPGNPYPLLISIWTNEGQGTDFEFCLTEAQPSSCGDGQCDVPSESYTDCQSDCPCLSSVELSSFISGQNTNIPEAVCPEIVGDITDPANLGLYIPFSINTDDPDLSGSLISSNVGTLFTSASPPILLPNNEANNALTYLFLTEAEIAAGGTVTISFGSDAGACEASLTFNITDLIAPATSECGNCNLNIVPDYANAVCNEESVEFTLNVENAIGSNIWISLDNNTMFNTGTDLLVALDGSTSLSYPTNDLDLIVYDEGNPNCALHFTLPLGDFTCSTDVACDNGGEIATTCRLDPTIADLAATCNSDGTINVPIDVGPTTGAVTFTPDVINGTGTTSDPYTVPVDLNNCQPIDFIITDESTCDEVPIVTVNSPPSIAGVVVVSTNTDDWGVQIPTELGVCGSGNAVEGMVAIVNDDDITEGQLTDFCEPTPPAQPDPSVCAPIAGQIVLIDRGGCQFTKKVENAQNCGAIGVIVCNCQVGPNWCPPDAGNILVTMFGGVTVNPITIPAVFMLYSDCQEIKAELNNGNDVEVCIGAPENLVGCERDFTLDVCNDYSTIACDDGDCSTENDVTTVNLSGTEICACNGSSVQCPVGETFNPNTCLCEGGGPCEEDISGSVVSAEPLCDLSNINMIITAPDGTMTTVTTDADGNFTVPGGPFPCGTYIAEFADATLLPSCYTDSGSTDAISFTLDGDSATDDGPNFMANSNVPTLSQWGLIVLALLLMSFGAAMLTNKQYILYQVVKH